MWAIQLTFLSLVFCRIFLSSLTHCVILLCFSNDRSNWSSPSISIAHISKLSRCFWSIFVNIQLSKLRIIPAFRSRLNLLQLKINHFHHLKYTIYIYKIIMLLLLLFVFIVQFRMQILQVLVCIIHYLLSSVWFPLIVFLLQDQEVSDYYWHSSRSVDKKNQLDVTFCILYFSSNSCSTCFGQPCTHHQELKTAWCYSLVLLCAVAAGRLSRPVGR